MLHKKIIIECITLAFISLSTFSQLNTKDVIFDWIHCTDDTWLPVDSSLHKFIPTNEEVGKAKELSIQYIDSLQNAQDNKDIKYLNYDHLSYYRQYLGYMDENGDKIIFINAFCIPVDEKRNIQTDWVFVLDGGSCYYQIRINLTRSKCFNFSVNGVA